MDLYRMIYKTEKTKTQLRILGKEFVENNYVEVYDLPENFWNMDYSVFLDDRRKLMAKSIHNYFEKL